MPRTMSYQGVLTDAGGVPVDDGDYSLTFRIYDDPGGAANPLWEETQAVTVDDGAFDVILGEVNPLTIAFDAPYWLGISIEGEPELVPLTELTSAPYALRAAVAESLSGGAVNDHDWEFDGDDIYRLIGRVGIGTSDPTNPLVVRNDHDSNTVVRIENAHSGQWSGALLMLQDEEGKGVIGFYDGEHPFQPDALSIANERNFPGGPVTLRTRNNDRVYVSAEGDVGIGTVTPAERLDVAGTTRTTGFVLPTDAAVGYVLTSDSAGEGTWQPAAGGIGGSGTADWIPRFTGTSTIGNSSIYEESDGDIVITDDTSIDGRLDVETSTARAGVFTSDYNSTITNVVYAEFLGTGTVDATAVYGRSVPRDYYGIGGKFYGGFVGVEGVVAPSGSQHYTGVYGQVSGGVGANYAVYGYATGGTSSYAIYGQAAVAASSYAGYFDGNVHVTGDLTGGKGASRIDHPLDPANRYLTQSYVESPEMKSVHDGVVVLDGRGEAWVELPEWFGALAGDFRYQLTAIGAAGPNLHVADKITDNRFRIAGGDPGMEVSWMVTGIRRDPFAEAYRTVVEEDKPAVEVGKYVNPELYGQPETMAVTHQERRPTPE